MERTLNPKQAKFCKLYATDVEFFGNGVESYVEVYKPDKSRPNWYKSACSSASRLLSNAKVFEKINELLQENGLNDAFIDKQILFLISQHADFSNKLGAIREYNKLRERIIERHDVTSKGRAIDTDLSTLYKMSYEELRKFVSQQSTAKRIVQGKSRSKRKSTPTMQGR